MKTGPLSRQRLARLTSAAAAFLALVALPAPVGAQTRAKDDPITPGVPYYLIGHTVSGARGTTFEVYLNYDWVLLSNDEDYNGTPVVFEQDGDAYRIRSTSSHWAGYDTWCWGGDDGITLTRVDKCRSSRWRLQPAEGGGWFIRVAGTGRVLNNPLKGKQWLKASTTLEPAYRQFTRFTFTPAS
ncbi:hypothetical protein ACQP2K_18105 [Microbispora siamensis]